MVLDDPREVRVAKPNYAFAKRQRDLAKKQRKEAKKLKKAESGEAAPDAGAEQPVPADKGTPQA